MHRKTAFLLLGVIAIVVLWRQQQTYSDDPLAATPPQIAEGASVTCNDGTGMVYRFTGNQLRYYPSPAIAASWNPQWGTGIVSLTAQQCQAIPKGEPMPMRAVPPPAPSPTSINPPPNSTKLTSGRTSMGCHTAIGEDRVSCSTIRPRNSRVAVKPPAEDFIIEHLNPAQGTFAIKSAVTGKYCSDDNGRLQCRRDQVGAWETFTAVRNADDPNKVAIKGYRLNQADGRFCSDEGTNINCNRPTAAAWETFTASNVQAFVPPLPPLPPDFVDNADVDYSSTTTMFSSENADVETAAVTGTVVPVVLGVTAAAGASYAMYLYALK